jgi:hypothetical protein
MKGLICSSHFDVKKNFNFLFRCIRKNCIVLLLFEINMSLLFYDKKMYIFEKSNVIFLTVRFDNFSKIFSPQKTQYPRNVNDISEILLLL